MHKLACKDVGVSSTCDYEATGSSLDEVVDLEMAHAKATHAQDIQATGLSDEDLRATAVLKVREEGGDAATEEEEEDDDKEEKDDGADEVE